MKISLAMLEEAILPLVSKPNRYLGNIENAAKTSDKNVALKVLLAFPDTYEIGMSHLGIRILHHILSQREDTLCEMTFAPWVDMEEALREHDLPLFSLESRRPADEFDLVGFSLQYELHFTNVLNMLSMGGIPVLASDRSQDDPVVMAGGPCAFNPEPMSPFIDCFVIGDGEEVINEVADTIIEGKRVKAGRKDILRLLAGLEGVYVPAFHEQQISTGGYVVRRPREPGIPARIKSRFVAGLRRECYPEKPLLPLTEIAHDRLTIEVMRGCTRGCRFCMAGYINRPVREKSGQDVLTEATMGIASTGWSEISLSSLSTSDYSFLGDVVPALRRTFLSRNVSLSLPSLRPGTLDRAILVELSSVRRPGLTFAPEAGTDRLRRRINKPISLEDLIETVRAAKQEGFRSIKLYYMIGLPGEEVQDLEGIADMAAACVRAGRKEKGSLRIKLSISPFVPKPHTAFQWESMDNLECLKMKIQRLRGLVRTLPVEFKWRNPEKSIIEASFSRGDASLGNAVHSAWTKGAKFDGWTDYFNFELWQEALRESRANVRMVSHGFGAEEELPWDHVQGPVSKEFLASERLAAAEGSITEDCRASGCTNCGVEDCPMLFGGPGMDVSRAGSLDLKAGGEKADAPCEPKEIGDHTSLDVSGSGVFGRSPRKEKRERETSELFRVRFSKGERLRFLSHLDVMRRLEMALRRSGLRPSIGGGEVSRFQFSFGPPLPLGMTSLCEYFDLSLLKTSQATEILQLNTFLPDGLRVEETASVVRTGESLMSSITQAEYSVSFTPFVTGLLGENGAAELASRLTSGLASLDEMKEFNVDGRNGLVDVKPSILSIRLTTGKGVPSVTLRVLLSGVSTARPERIVNALAGGSFDWRLLSAHRTGLWINRNGVAVTPMEFIAKNVSNNGVK
ncbi:MAG: TIGR03960 family B12-binding radical SAM protein [Candidatus Eisenbacteria bacterium]|nr:TIGR03960 family B12-binding radical SAM protein [Candidatus Eisenbacteria bacterium]